MIDGTPFRLPWCDIPRRYSAVKKRIAIVSVILASQSRHSPRRRPAALSITRWLRSAERRCKHAVLQKMGKREEGLKICRAFVEYKVFGPGAVYD